MNTIEEMTKRVANLTENAAKISGYMVAENFIISLGDVNYEKRYNELINFLNKCMEDL